MQSVLRFIHQNCGEEYAAIFVTEDIASVYKNTSAVTKTQEKRAGKKKSVNLCYLFFKCGLILMTDSSSYYNV